MSSNQDIVGDVTKGIAKAGIEWTEEKLKQFVRRFKDRNLIFVEESETIALVKEQRKKGEWNIFKSYIKDNDFRILFQTGLALREIERRRNDFNPLIIKIRKKYKEKGVSIARFVQNGLFSRYLGSILDTGAGTEEVKSEIEDLFENIDKKVVFIDTTDKPKIKTTEIITKIYAHSPNIFIISSAGTAAKVCEKIKKGVMSKISSNYICEFYEAEQTGLKKSIYILSKILSKV